MRVRIFHLNWSRIPPDSKINGKNQKTCGFLIENPVISSGSKITGELYVNDQICSYIPYQVPYNMFGAWPYNLFGIWPYNLFGIWPYIMFGA